MVDFAPGWDSFYVIVGAAITDRTPFPLPRGFEAIASKSSPWKMLQSIGVGSGRLAIA